MVTLFAIEQRIYGALQKRPADKILLAFFEGPILFAASLCRCVRATRGAKRLRPLSAKNNIYLPNL